MLAVFLVDTCNSYRVATDIADEGFEQLGTLGRQKIRTMSDLVNVER